MEYKKDNAISQKPQDSKNLIVFQLFEKDSHLIFVYKKAEKIASALYLVSNLLSDSEPLKWQFREVGVGIITKILSLNTKLLSKSETASFLFSDIISLVSFLEIARAGGLITDMNFAILKTEIEALLEAMHTKVISKNSTELKTPKFDQDFFAVPRHNFIVDNDMSPPSSLPGYGEYAHTLSDVGRLEEFYKRHNKGQSFIKDSPLHTDLSFTNTKYKNTTRGKANSSEFVDVRKTQIVGLLKTKNDLTIKDFSLIIKDCSEKTIQRELLKLVKQGVLKKQGERRWSRYSLSLV